MEIKMLPNPPPLYTGVTAGYVSMSHPSKLRIQTTGPDQELLLDEGPPVGKRWQVDVRISLVESDL